MTSASGPPAAASPPSPPHSAPPRPASVNARNAAFDSSAPDARTAARLAEALRERVRGEVRFDSGSRALYATDSSNYRQVPIGVVVPRDADDVSAAVAVCREHRVPLLARGGGTSLAGQACNVAVVLDFSKYNHIGVQWCRGCPFQCEFCDIIELFGRVPRLTRPRRQLRFSVYSAEQYGHFAQPVGSIGR